MSRFNLLIPKDLYKFLKDRSLRDGVTKAKYIRTLLVEKKDQDFFNKNRYSYKQWSLVGHQTFNFILPFELNNWLEQSAARFACTKGEIVRFILWSEFNRKEVLKERFLRRPSKIYDNETQVLINTVQSYLKHNNYIGLNKYLAKFNEVELINMGIPEFFIETIAGLEKNFPYVAKSLLRFKSKMHWYMGNIDTALDELGKIKVCYNENPILKLQIQSLYGEIFTDLGLTSKAIEIFERIIKTFDSSTPNWYKMKTHEKMGLSFYYMDDLDKVKYYYEKALTFAKTDTEYAVAYRYLGSINHSLEDYETAEKYYSLAEEYFYKSPNKNLNEYSRFLITYSEFNAIKANWRKAKNLAEEGFFISNHIQHKSNISWALRALATACFNLGEIEQTFEHIDKSIEIADFLGSIRLITKGYRDKAKYLISQGDFNGASKALEKSRTYETKLGGQNSSYNMSSKWQNYINLANQKDVDYKSLHNQSRSLHLKNHLKDETLNEYVLGYLYLASKDIERRETGVQILKQVHEHSMEVGNKQVQFGIETALKYGDFTTI